jgi:PiT family inorganic phosphate transporter
MLIATIVLALIFNFLNGMQSSANIVATVISSRALSPRATLLLTALGEFIGPLLFGVAVAKTVGAELFNSSDISLEILVAALLGTVIWYLITGYFGIPSSSSHSLIGGLLGAALAAEGVDAIRMSGLTKIIAALLLAPLLGLLVGFLITKLLFFLTRKSTPRVNRVFQRAQVFTAFGLALSHGANDAQKTMGVITLGLLTAGQIDSFAVPIWVVLASAAGMALGTSLGGWRLIRTLGRGIINVRPVHSLASQLSGLLVVLTAVLLGGPVSLTQVIGPSIMGSGAAQRVKMVRWQVGREMMIAWLLTIPVAGLIAALAYWLISALS